MLKGHHVMAERGVEGRSTSRIEQRRQITKDVPRHDELYAIDMRPLMHEFLAQRPKEGTSAGSSSVVPAVLAACTPRA